MIKCFCALLLLLAAILRWSNIYKIFSSEEVNTHVAMSIKGWWGVGSSYVTVAHVPMRLGLRDLYWSFSRTMTDNSSHTVCHIVPEDSKDSNIKPPKI